MRKDQRLADVVERRLNKVDKPVVEGPDGDKTKGQVNGGVNDAFAKLVQCSIRLMPGSSARSLTAARALPIASPASSIVGRLLGF